MSPHVLPLVEGRESAMTLMLLPEEELTQPQG